MAKPWHLYVVGILALLWNALGALDYALVQLGVTQYTANLPDAMVAHMDGYPAWITAVWALAVWLPLLAALLLLGGRRAAAGFFGLSLICILVSAVWLYVVNEPPLHVVAGPSVIGLWAAVLVIAVFEWLYARTMVQRGVLT